MENGLGLQGQTAVEDREDNAAVAPHTNDKTAADPSCVYLKIQFLWLASNILQAFCIAMFRYGGGAAVVGFIIQVLFFYLKAGRANTFGDEEQRHDWLEKHNTQRQRWEWVTPVSVLVVWIIARQARLRLSKDPDFRPFRGCWTPQERLTGESQWIQGWWTRLIAPHLAWMVTRVHDAKARATALHRTLEPTAQQARRSSEDSEGTLIEGEEPENRIRYVCAGVQTEIEDHLATSDRTDGSATHVGEIQSLRWPDHVLKDRVSILARFRDLTFQEKRQKERLTHRARGGKLTSQEMRDLEDLELLNFEVNCTTLRIPPVTELHAFDGILSPSATNENVWQLLVPALWTFSRGRPTCVFFDGYSGTGKSYTMFKGPNAIAGQFTGALDAFLRTQGVPREFDVATATVQYDRGKDPGKAVHGPSAKGASLQEARGKIEEAWQQRDGSNRKTANNPESSRSHLIIQLSVDVVIGNERFHSSLALVDLAGNEKEIQGHDLGATKTARRPTAKEESEAEQQAAERKFIHNSRSALQSSLIDPSNLSSINGSEFTKYLKKYLLIEKKTPKPKVFHFSCLSPFKSKLPHTQTTLNFATELQSPKRQAEAIPNPG